MYRIMIVEDEDVIRWGLKDHVPWEKYGFQVIGEANNGKSALELVPRLSPDVAVVDIMMPVMNGIEFIKALKEGFPSIKVIVLSGYSEFDYARQCIEYGAGAYLIKPVKNNDIERILLKIKNELDISHNMSNKMEAILKGADANRSVIKEKLVDDILEGKLEEEYIRAEFLPDDIFGIAMHDYLSVILFHSKIDTERNTGIIEKKDEVLNGINESLSFFENVKCFEILYKGINNQVVILSSVNTLQEHTAVNIALSIKKQLTGIYYAAYSCNVIVSAGIGSCNKNIRMLKNSYDEAKRALKYKFFKGKGSVIHIGECVGQSGKAAETIHLLNNNNNIISNIVESTKSCNKDILLKSIDNFFELMDYLENGDEEIVYMKIVELIIMLSMKLGESNMDFKDIYDKNIYRSIRNFIDNGTLLELKSWIKDICLKVINFINSYVREKKIDPIIEKAKKYIKENYDKKLSIEEICDLLFISPSYFSSLFKQKTGLTFTHYLTSVRIARAREILLMPDAKVYEVAMAVGYDDFRHFSKLFKKLEGVSPQQYRQMKPAVQKDQMIGDDP